MQTGEVIRKYRKERNMTQEEMAKRLGVTAPAVNKWEKGVSQPDITLLAPIARLLGITLETLMSFHEVLSAEEIGEIIKEVDRKFETDSYDEVFLHAAGMIQKYPNCHQLIWQLAMVLDARCMMDETVDSEKYETQIREWYVRALESTEETVQRNAAGSLFQYYFRKENYEEAERYISYFSEEDPERKRKQAVIYSGTGRREEAYKTYEEILFSGYQMLSSVMHSLYMLSVEDTSLERAKMWIEKESGLAELFDMGVYRAESCKLDLATWEKDEEKTFSVVKNLLDSMEQMSGFSESDMYAHLKFKGVEQSFYVQLRKNLIKLFRSEDFSYMEHSPEWKKLVGSSCKEER